MFYFPYHLSFSHCRCSLRKILCRKPNATKTRAIIETLNVEQKNRRPIVTQSSSYQTQYNVWITLERTRTNHERAAQSLFSTLWPSIRGWNDKTLVIVNLEYMITFYHARLSQCVNTILPTDWRAWPSTDPSISLPRIPAHYSHLTNTWQLFEKKCFLNEVPRYTTYTSNVTYCVIKYW